MLSAYIVCLIAGGILLGASLLGGHDSHVDMDAHGHDLHTHHEWLSKLPFLSLRFWTWGSAFFGLTGLTLSLCGTSAGPSLALAILTGVGTGWGASHVIAKLTKSTVGLLPDAGSHVGREGRLLLPLERGKRSKVRLKVGGTDVDLVAETDNQEALPTGALVLVVGLRGTHAVVESSPVASLDSTDNGKEKP
jgi:hypothetical protein